MGKIYFPLKPTKPAVKEPLHHVVIVSNDSGDTFGVITSGVYLTMDSDTVVDFIFSLPRSAWVFTYSSQWITQLFSNYLGRLKRLEAIGEYQCTTITTDSTKVYIVDLFQVTMETIWSTARKLGIPLASIDKGTEAYLNSKALAVQRIADLYAELIVSVWGVYPSKTTGATSLKTWRATLSDDIEIKVRGAGINQLSYNAIRPGALNWSEGYYSQGYHYDINGSYIHAMRTIKLPIFVKAFSNREPANNKWIATVKLNYASNLHWGVLPIRASTGQLFRPTVIRDYITTITYLDYILMKATGEVQITQWLEGVYWEDKDEYRLFDTWINKLIEATSEPSNKYLVKNVSRALHSKFAQNTEWHSIVLVKPKSKQETEQYIKNKQLVDIIFTPDGEVLQIEENHPPHFVPFQFPQWEALILAMGRIQLYTMVDSNTIYTDTDCIISKEPRHDLPLDNGFGNWKLEAHGQTAIIAPRTYVCGNTVKATGVHATSHQALKIAILDASRGEASEVEKIETGNIIKQTKTEIKKHTIKIEKYPKVELYGNILTVTRSPPVFMKAITSNRLYSIDKPVFNIV